VTRPTWCAAFWAIVSALFRRQVVARPLGYLVKGGHGGPAAFVHGHGGELRDCLDGLYLSFETDQRPRRLHDAFPGSTLTRLRELKASCDPENVFDQNFPVPPLAAV
jgi:berberine-like enzyme